ncbi:MAG: response regulator [Armatimonadetes bacterium]|nr:response regulator [Armatimonadota bacterium]
MSNPVPVTVLAIEDDLAIRRLLKVSFENTEFRLLEAENAADGIDLIAKRRPDIVLLDIGLPDSDGMDVIKTVRSWSGVPILIVSGEGDEDRKVKALESGADDYVTKPFGVSELFARMKVALRHQMQAGNAVQEPVFASGDLTIDRAAREVTVRGERIHLTPIEFKLLLTLAKYAGKVVTHRQLLAEVWGEEYTEESQYLRVYMGYLRKKIEADPERPVLLLNEPRIGYRLVV